jgi:hypothetical protein
LQEIILQSFILFFLFYFTFSFIFSFHHVQPSLSGLGGRFGLSIGEMAVGDLLALADELNVTNREKNEQKKKKK